jgi:hypothetical protein
MDVPYYRFRGCLYGYRTREKNYCVPARDSWGDNLNVTDPAPACAFPNESLSVSYRTRVARCDSTPA